MKNYLTSPNFRQLISRFSRDQEGSLLPLVAASMMMLTGAAGVAIDGARMFYVKDVLQKSLDSAGLAAGHAMDAETMENDAREFFEANVASIANLLTSSSISTTISEDSKTITLSGTATIAASFTKLFGVNEITLNVSTEILRETRGMELAIVMDNTGSMASSGKMDAAKEAAALLVETVYGDEDTGTNLWVSVIPYVAHVNMGETHEDWLSSAGQTRIDNGDFLPTEWAGCVMVRADGEDLTDTPPSEEPFEPWYWEDEPNYYYYYYANNWIDDYGNRTINESNNRYNAKGPNRGCGQAILPLTESKATVLAAIDEMAPWSFGGTASPTGLAWGWRTLSERWQGLWGGSTPAELPLANDAPFMDKVLIILTDGKNEFISRTTSLGRSDFTAYGTITEFGFSSTSAARDEVDDRFDDLCQNVKDGSIIIYAITFGSSPDSSTRTAFENCATNPAFYFHAPSNGELQDVFDTIGRQLSNLRLSQ
ncbi:MAG: hypothetical protein JKY60_11505 [Kordiimonadaceae bacterium]|nr:hypothetical protein [Kordiimonadaceae bacterium]